MKTIVLSLLLIMNNLLAEENNIPSFRLNVEKDGSVYFFKATPPENHHFNLKTPYKASKNKSTLKAYKVSKDLIQYNVAKSLLKKEDQIEFTLFICDNENKYCVKQTQMWSQESKTQVSNTKNSEVNSKSAVIEKDEFGFIMNNPEAALELSKKEGRHLLIDFYAIWCPPCNELDEVVYPSKEFRDLKNNFILLKLDADSPISWKLKSKHLIKGYPTVIIVDSTGIELTRMIGFFPPKEFSDNMKLSLRSDSAVNSPERLASAAFYSEDWKKAQKLYFELNKSNPQNKDFKEKLLQSELNDLKETSKSNKSKLKEYISKLESSIKDTDNTIFSMESAMALVDVYEEQNMKEKKAETLKKGLAIAQNILNTNISGGKVNGSDYTDADIYQQIADFNEQLEQFDEAKSAYMSASKIYQTKIKKLGKLKARGYSLELAFCQWKSGYINKAQKIYEQYEKKYPNEFTFYYAHSKMLYNIKDFKGAKTKAEKALLYSYGDNKLRATENLAKIYIELKDKPKALETLNSTLNTIEKPSDTKVRTNGYLETLSKLKTTIERTDDIF